MKPKYAVVAVLGAVVVCAGLFYVGSALHREARRTQRRSAYGALNMALINSLAGYYSETGKYPEALGELTDIEYSDGARPEMVGDFRYEVREDGCSISYRYDSGAAVRMTYMREGRLARGEE